MNLLRIALAVIAIAILAGSWLVSAPAVEHFRAAHWISPPAEGIPGYSTLAATPIQNLSERVFDRQVGETDRDVITRLNGLIHSGSWNCAPQDFTLSEIEQHVHAVMGSPNIFSEGILIRSRFGCGFCHQRATLLTSALIRNNIVANVFGLNGHVVVRVELPDEALFVDPDLGVAPMNGSEQSILDGYSPLGHGDPQEILAMYQSWEDNSTYPWSYLSPLIDAQNRLFKEADRLAWRKATLGGALLGLALSLLAISALLGRNGLNSSSRPEARRAWRPQLHG